jgi:hypothetical protein
MNPEAGGEGADLLQSPAATREPVTDGEFRSHPGPNQAPHQAVGRSGFGPFGPGRSLARIRTCVRRSAPGRK